MSMSSVWFREYCRQEKVHSAHLQKARIEEVFKKGEFYKSQFSVQVNKSGVFVRGISREEKILRMLRAHRDPPLRGKVKRWSLKSRARLFRLLMDHVNTFEWMVTLTYHRNMLEGKESKKHLKNWVRSMERIFGKKGFLHVWVMEFQRRGSIHYHVFMKLGELPENSSRRFRNAGKLRRGLALDERGRLIMGLMSAAWVEVSGQAEDAAAVKAAIDLRPIVSGGFVRNYAMKYVMKNEQKDVPKDAVDVGRFWGGNAKLDLLYESFSMVEVRIIKKWLRKQGIRLAHGYKWLANAELQERMRILCRTLLQDL